MFWTNLLSLLLFGWTSVVPSIEVQSSEENMDFCNQIVKTLNTSVSFHLSEPRQTFEAIECPNHNILLAMLFLVDPDPAKIFVSVGLDRG
jgi:hypothetical protein